MSQGNEDGSELCYSHLFWFALLTYLLVCIALADGQWKLNHALAIEVKNRLIVSVPLAQKINNKIAGDIDQWAIKKWGIHANDPRLKLCKSSLDSNSKELSDSDLEAIRKSKNIKQILKATGKPFCISGETQVWLVSKNRALVVQQNPLKVVIKKHPSWIPKNP